MKSIKLKNYEGLFKKGEYELLKKSFDKNDYSEDEFPWVLAGMCFLGRLDDLKIIIKKRKLSCFECFFLIIAATRIGDYQSAKKWIQQLGAMSFQSKRDSDLFFYYQALAFYSHIHCRYRISLALTKRSHQYSLFLSNSLWKVLAIDLLGHNYIHMGNIHQGLFYLNEGRTLSSEMGNKSWVSAATVSILSYKAQFSENPEDDKSKIKKHLKKIKNNDNYSEGLLLLSLAHLEMLTGQMEECRLILNKAQTIIFGNQVLRHMGLWHFEKAYYHYLTGEAEIALSELQRALGLTTTRTDKKLRLKILGLKQQIGNRLGKKEIFLDQEILDLSKSLGDPRSHNQLARRGIHQFVPSEDPLESLFNEFSSENWQKSITGIIHFGLWGLLREKVASKQRNYLVTGLWKSGALFITQHNVYPVFKGVSDLLLKAFLILNAKNKVSKEELVESLWGYQYDPSRHDTLIFSLIHRLKVLMGTLGLDIKGEAHHYNLRTKYDILELSPLKDELIQSEILHSSLLNGQSFNIRQQQALLMIKKGRFFKVSDYAQEFKVTTMTALRDLKELLDQHQIVKYGRARSTTYGEVIK
ncbi:MAG: hypothetical protein COW00_07550 [Bdellovibrio sp. CG12_big_fil_rev_8_21_14_0_65_39_13]|nr:MAG: hypothetical protein COW78_12230 [Bdellovibrio sp. CG22_combo_CG10-13_8_21_14_all_39_27]PIQ60110.1 MAG: hypothetical protein COW00_07550 [Bdellovibrio sp. CG12_big_fil_rev_8_21_14_0_65_39_13]PIR36746.1 MAG: hypothetical protein COV37_01050 [Bdellovibrio sp. CG11_big_fil_rev_8_21_14_0_20_39_38]PJB53800.1 MAG: hypothetical protein CO099_05110 [Bdellovibrio sp. CG_4_9_14_3_um_filter_39_7]